MPLRSGPHEVRNCREAAVPEKGITILKEGCAATRAHLTKMNAQPPYEFVGEARYKSYI